MTQSFRIANRNDAPEKRPHGIGSGDVVAATVGGARYGVLLLWAIAVGAFFKYVLNEGIARWQLATGKTALEGWAEYLPAWVKWYFGVYLVLWTVFVSAALTNATGLGISNLTGGRIPQSWGGVFHSLFGFVFVILGGYGGFEKLMKTLVGVMGFSILVCAALTFHDPAGVLQGTFVPAIPAGAGLYVLSIIGGIGGSVSSDRVRVHIHLDHAGAAGWLARQGAQIYVHPVGAPHMVNPERLLASAARIYGDQMQALWGEFLPVPEEKLTVPEDGEEIEIGNLKFRPINTPGHAEHHYAYLFEDICFSGDVGGVRIPGYQYLRVPMPPPELHIERWHESMKRLHQQKFARIAPTHFGIYDDPEWQLREVDKALYDAERWIEKMMSEDPTPPIEAMRESFTAWMVDQGAAYGLSEDVLAAYGLANPPGMSADGLYRYWKKVKNPA